MSAISTILILDFGTGSDPTLQPMKIITISDLHKFVITAFKIIGVDSQKQYSVCPSLSLMHVREDSSFD
jgi:hypothetical protein